MMLMMMNRRRIPLSGDVIGTSNYNHITIVNSDGKVLIKNIHPLTCSYLSIVVTERGRLKSFTMISGQERRLLEHQTGPDKTTLPGGSPHSNTGLFNPLYLAWWWSISNLPGRYAQPPIEGNRIWSWKRCSVIQLKWAPPITAVNLSGWQKGLACPIHSLSSDE